MSDDSWKRRSDDDFGAPLFGDDSVEGLSFGDGVSEPMPHWTAPPTGEVPATLAAASDDAEVDVWSSFAGQAPTWSDSDAGRSLDDLDDLAPVFDEGGTPRSGLFDDSPVAQPATGGGRSRFDDFGDDVVDAASDDSSGVIGAVSEETDVDLRPSGMPMGARRGSRSMDPAADRGRRGSRIQIGTDPTDGVERDRSSGYPPGPDGPVRGRPSRSGPSPRPPGAVPGRVSPTRPGARPGARPGGRPAGSGRRSAPAATGTKGRDMPTAVAVGVAIAAVFLAALKFSPWAVAVIVVVVLGLGAVEFFDRVADRGYLPAKAPGIVACVAAPVAVYHYGIDSLPIVVFLALTAMAATFVAASSLESNPLPNMAITALGVTWIGVLGSFGTGLLEYGRTVGVATVGTDTLCLLAIAVVANDVGALFVGSAVGRTPLRPWISPNKSVEGFVGGTALTLGAMFLVNVSAISTTWNSLAELLLLGVVVALAAPLGDLTESMFKRNLDVKDFGTIVKGHGGILDRFDGFLFTLPAVYFLLVALEPWAS
ncbi:MAG: putative phosphatidate cytidylyltransferase [Actinomycetota bacterium]